MQDGTCYPYGTSHWGGTGVTAWRHFINGKQALIMYNRMWRGQEFTKEDETSRSKKKNKTCTCSKKDKTFKYKLRKYHERRNFQQTLDRKTKLCHQLRRQNSLKTPNMILTHKPPKNMGINGEKLTKNLGINGDKLYSVVHLPHLNKKMASLVREMLRCSHPHA